MAQKKFTERWILSCRAPAGGRVEYVDALCPGLWLRVSGKRDIRSFSVLYRCDGRLVRQTIGRHPRWTLQDARAEAQRILRLADARLDPRQYREHALFHAQPLPGQPLRVAGATYDELVDTYGLYLTRNGARTAKAAVSNLRHRYLSHLRKRQAATITKRDLLDAIETLMAANLPQAALNTRGVLMSMFRYAHDQDLIPTNPALGIRPPAKVTLRERVLSDSELAAIWRASLEMPEAASAFYRLLMLTGQRRTEVSHMGRSELQGDLWVIPSARAKSRRAHSVPLTATAAAILGALPDHGPSSFVISTCNGQRPISGYAKFKAQLDALSATSGWRIHDIRRTVRTRMAALKVPREIARRVMNHSMDSIDSVYDQHSYNGEKRAALELWERSLLEIVHGAKPENVKLKMGCD